MVVLPCLKPKPQPIPVPIPKLNAAFVRFTRVNNQGERNNIQKMIKSVVVEEWNKITSDMTIKLIESLPNMLPQKASESTQTFGGKSICCNLQYKA
ncbi:hypothetical protein TNCV_1047001 [Trichonephila clavipes]|nr:hypothetical protein TNCV_1047001 [Trichonephila clavipes]